jgi:hypothetical protein
MYSSFEHKNITPSSINKNTVIFKFLLDTNQYIVRLYLKTTKKIIITTIYGNNDKLAKISQAFLDMTYQFFHPIQLLDAYERMKGKGIKEPIDGSIVYPIGYAKESQMYFKSWSQKYKNFTVEFNTSNDIDENDEFVLWLEVGSDIK